MGCQRTTTHGLYKVWPFHNFEIDMEISPLLLINISVIKYAVLIVINQDDIDLIFKWSHSVSQEYQQLG